MPAVDIKEVGAESAMGAISSKKVARDSEVDGIVVIEEEVGHAPSFDEVVEAEAATPTRKDSTDEFVDAVEEGC